MASATALRPALLLRQALAAPSRRAVFSSPTTSASIPAIRSRLQQARPSALNLCLQRAAFQTTAHRSILTPLPEKIKGTVNDQVVLPPPEPAHGSYHWTAERHISVSLIPLTVAPFAAGSLSPLMDGALIAAVLLHSHIGFQSCITDYFPKWRAPRMRRALDWTLNIFLVIVGVGWYEFETNDVGITQAIKRVWTARPHDV